MPNACGNPDILLIYNRNKRAAFFALKEYVLKEKLSALLTEEKIKEFRAIPFWSWNDDLEIPELERQIEWMKKEGFGGYFMHARGGLTTEYLGEKWFDCTKACIEKGAKEGMESWAYDENGWPSGFAGGKLLSDPENCDRYITHEHGAYDKAAMVSYRIDGDKFERVKDGDNTDSGEYLNLYEHISNSTADILNGEVVDKFISETHEQYKKRFGKDFGGKLKGFFTDEPQYYRWGHPYTKVLPAYFKDKYGADILDGLGLMFIEREGYRAFRYKYWLSMQSLMLTNFAKKIYDWCNESGCEFTGHYVEETALQWQDMCCAGVMPFYEYETMPGMDHLGDVISGAVAPKQLGSVAAQLGKKRVLTETYGCCGWGVTPRKLKRIAESQFVYGVNLMCQHLLPYSEHGQRKRDYPAHYSWSNPWVRHDFKSFNDYFARLGCLIGNSREIVNVAIFCPVRSTYFDYKREGLGKRMEVDESYMYLADRFARLNVPYHFADETVMEKHGRVENGKLIIGNCSYKYLVFPKTYTMGKRTKELFDEFAAQGGKILFTEGVPEYLEGEPYDFGYESNVTLEEIIADQEYTISDTNTEIRSALREIDGKKFIYCVNVGESTYKVKFNGKFKGFTALNLEDLSEKAVSTELTFNSGDSYVLFFSEEAGEKETELSEISLSGTFEVTEDSGNYFTLDKLSYSTDGVNYSDKIRYMGVFWELLKKRYNGEVYLKYEFNVKEVPSRLYFLAEDMNNEYCEVNGQKIEFTGESDFEKKLYKADISSLVKEGVNTAIIKINFYQAENVYYVLFGGVNESLKNCLVYDTTIEACYLFGDFGVYPEKGFKEGSSKDVLVGDNFYIGKKKQIVTDIVKDGYPFFAGNITLKKTFESDGKPVVLRLFGDFCLAEIKINGKNVKKSYFADRVNITDYVKKGKNVAEITLYSANRNLLGPCHLKGKEKPLNVGPYTWELEGSWENGVSSQEVSEYAFVRFGLYE